MSIIQEASSDVLKRIWKNNPSASEKEIFDLAWEHFNKSKNWRPIFEYWFANRIRALDVEIREHSITIRKKAAALRKAGRRRINIEKDKLKFALMDHVLSSGKLLRFATREEGLQESGWIHDAAMKLPPGGVFGKHLKEIDLRNIRMRNSKPPLRRVA